MECLQFPEKEFKDFPCQRANYVAYGKSTKFPLKFCAICWLENVPVLQRGIEVLKPLKLYFCDCKKIPKSQNYVWIKKLVEEDDFLEAQMEFMLSIAHLCQPFLLHFQSNNPMAPFLYDEMINLINIISKKFLKNQSSSYEVTDDNLKDPASVDIGFGALHLVERKKNIAKVLQFKSECRTFLKEMYQKLVEKCPVDNRMIKGVSALSPSIMINKKK